jgi:membrane associated rhomboid family serine protease
MTMLLGAVCSGITFGLLETTAAPMVGASGVVFALIGVWLQTSRAEALRTGRPARSASVVIISLIVLHIFMDIFMGGQIAWQAHLGGFVMGYFVVPWFVGREKLPT